jgi:hypothetical protein
MIFLFTLSTISAIAATILTLKLKTDVRPDNDTGFIDLSLNNRRPLRSCCEWYRLYGVQANPEKT